jgi:hypothetical protein
MHRVGLFGWFFFPLMVVVMTTKAFNIGTPMHNFRILSKFEEKV